MRALPMLALVLLAAFAIPAGAQPRAAQGTRIAGTVKSVSAGHVVLVTTGGDVDVTLTSHTRVFVRRPASIRDIKPGAYLGTANQNSATGSNAGTATEVHLATNGPNVNSPMNDSGLTMTNGHVKTVTSTPHGVEMDIDYGQKTTRHVLVKDGTAIVKMNDVGIAGLKPGLQANAMTRQGTDGRPTATFILVGPPPGAP